MEPRSLIKLAYTIHWMMPSMPTRRRREYMPVHLILTMLGRTAPHVLITEKSPEIFLLAIGKYNCLIPTTELDILITLHTSEA
jgi:hypothetical protein